MIPLFKFILLQVRFFKLFEILIKLADIEKKIVPYHSNANF